MKPVFKLSSANPNPIISYYEQEDRIYFDLYQQNLYYKEILKNINFSGNEEIIIKNSENLENILNQLSENNENSLVCALVLGKSILKSKEEDRKQIESFKNLRNEFHYTKISKFLLIDYQNLKENRLFSDTEKISIFLFSNKSIISKDYLKDKDFIHDIINKEKK